MASGTGIVTGGWTFSELSGDFEADVHQTNIEPKMKTS